MATNPIKKAPVTTVSVVEAVVGFVLAMLVARHVISPDVAKTYGPGAVVVLVALAGAVKWSQVTPVVKVEHLLATAGKLSDVDLGRLEAMLIEHLGADKPIAEHPELGTDDDVPDGLAAGAPADPPTVTV